MANHFAPCVEMTNPTEFERHRLMYHFGGLDPRNHLWESEASAFQGY
jgi:hypothetical protein